MRPRGGVPRGREPDANDPQRRDLPGTREVTNMSAGTEDPYGTRQVPPGDEGRAIETRGWDRVGYAGDRQGESLTPPHSVYQCAQNQCVQGSPRRNAKLSA